MAVSLNNHINMFVVKRGGRGREEVKFDKITTRIRHLTKGLSPVVDSTTIAIATIQNIYDGITTSELDLISAKTAEGMKLIHPDYGVLASRLLVSNLHKSTPDSFSECMELIDKSLSNINPIIMEFIRSNSSSLDKMIINSNDYNYDYLGIKTLERSYLHKLNDVVIDRPQYMYMRVAIQLYMKDGIEAIKACYKGMSNMLYTHATPTLFNSCCKHNSMLSCYLLGTHDSIEGIMKTLTDSSLISKQAGGIGIHMSNIRPQGSYIKGTNGKSAGLTRQLKMYDAMARCWDQGGRRQASIVIYMEEWNADIIQFLELRLPQGDETERCRDLFIALWMSDLFISRVKSNGDWSLFGDDTAPGLTDVFDGMEVCDICGKSRDGRVVGTATGDCALTLTPHKYSMRPMFTELYTKYECEGRAMRVIKARSVMDAIFKSQRETGMPYVCFKDHVNRRSNQSNAGVVKSSNLCVSGDTYVLTDQGQVKIRDLVNRDVNIWNGERWSNTRPIKTNTNQQLLCVSFSNGVSIECTPYHKFYLSDNTCVPASDLKVGDVLIKYQLPMGNSTIDTGSYPCHRNRDLMLSLRLFYQTYGIDTSVVRVNDEYTLVETDRPPTVTSVTPVPGLHDTFCYNETLRHMGMFNGILTGQCAEIVEVSTDKSYACCTLASINVKMFYDGKAYNYNALKDTVRQIIRNLDEIVYINKYPVSECVVNAHTLAPVAIGIQGLADLFCAMRIPFTSAEAERVDYAIAETIYYGAVEESCYRAEKLGAYPMFAGSPASEGLLQFDLYERNLKYMGSNNYQPPFSGMYDWDALKARVVKHGLRNSLLVAYMPTVSTAQIMGNNESFEPISSNLYTKTTLGGKFTVVNSYLVKHLIELNLYNESIRNRILSSNGSIQSITEIPQNVRDIYKTVWEVSQAELMRRSATRSAFIDQSSSLNLHIVDNSNPILRRILLDGHTLGHKTNSYYIRTKSASSALKNNMSAGKMLTTSSTTAPTTQPSTVHPSLQPPQPPQEPPEEEPEACRPGCTSCSG